MSDASFHVLHILCSSRTCASFVPIFRRGSWTVEWMCCERAKPVNNSTSEKWWRKMWALDKTVKKSHRKHVNARVNASSVAIHRVAFEFGASSNGKWMDGGRCCLCRNYVGIRWNLGFIGNCRLLLNAERNLCEKRSSWNGERNYYTWPFVVHFSPCTNSIILHNWQSVDWRQHMKSKQWIENENVVNIVPHQFADRRKT